MRNKLRAIIISVLQMQYFSYYLNSWKSFNGMASASHIGLKTEEDETTIIQKIICMHLSVLYVICLNDLSSSARRCCLRR